LGVSDLNAARGFDVKGQCSSYLSFKVPHARDEALTLAKCKASKQAQGEHTKQAQEIPLHLSLRMGRG
jgi:hypothetical protein